ncbi:MAG TPA: hypothetical protein VHC46_03910 [Thermodesulfobacteriota bacterium]|nr:hypothetical protein [Thermodesulfobacteriota bacterium]
MEIRSVFQIAKREWENISVSLGLCGDIGKFDLVRYIEREPRLIRNLIGMEKKLHEHDYLTREAAYVFTELGKEAGERLGLSTEMARAFGGGYSWVRTGWFDLISLEIDDLEILEDHLTRKILFFRLFFPLEEDFCWVFDSPDVTSNLKLIFDRFSSWQTDPVGYDKDLESYKKEIQPIKEGLASALDIGSGRC